MAPMGSWLAVLLFLACDAGAPPHTQETTSALADVVAAEVSGDQLAVTVRSPETGCAQYADWWEVVTPEGALVYRRVLGHSHPDEQPFTRSGGPVVAAPDAVLIVRAHMHPGGYGGAALQGTLAGGFSAPASVDASFAPGLAVQPPLPEGCAF